MAGEMFDPKIVDNAGTLEVYGDFTEVEVYQEKGATDDVPNMVIDPSRPFRINLKWQFNGKVGKVNSQLNDIPTKKWWVYVYAEKMGPGDDLTIYSTVDGPVIKDSYDTLPAEWSHTCEIPAGTIPSHLPGSGMYRLCIVVFANAVDTGCLDMVGCHEGHFCMFEDPSQDA